MQFVKYLLVAMSIELLCCFGLIEKEKPESKRAPVIIEQSYCIEQPAKAHRLPNAAKPMPIYIIVN